MRILLVEDDPDLAVWLSRSLAQRGSVVEWEEDGRLAELRLKTDTFDAIVLDLGLPSLDGALLLRKLRAADDATPTLIVTARDDLSKRVELLHAGADDFLAKPFAVEELEARLVALVRRSHGRARGVYQCGALAFDQNAQRFTLDREPLALAPREHAILRELIQRVGEPLTKQQLLDRLVSTDSDLHLEAVEVMVHRLRRKLAGASVQIVTLRGLGYFLEATESGPA
ncbi:response regulator [Aureimonas phyllosphaerae]|uniref:Two-component system response regulator TctD n=1 Tax=Aureimonas phyllosphaerae TaxID=1166078 RepID=A0A7W6FVR3_9HYPH|nr:response regulator [Aureimonas phyllosphaerae]MBB3937095.1 two-component system response regulator TctD [Aureimonas phyllosphaerae]MBB3960790.1 two-component system response regulator TctD [Aureimonas phyllosphaerae]SFF50157.1 two-component system, OmpR family, response regulator TctD [Aureimonas phyllosphaerae]